MGFWKKSHAPVRGFMGWKQKTGEGKEGRVPQHPGGAEGPEGMESYREKLLVLEDNRACRRIHALMVMSSTLAVLYLGGFDYGLGVPFLLAAIFLYTYKKRFYIGFEYSVTDGELAVDIIQERRKRSTALSIPVRDIELLVPVVSERYRTFVGNRTVEQMYPKGTSGTEYALIHKGKEYRLKPSEEMLRTLRTYNIKSVEN